MNALVLVFVTAMSMFNPTPTSGKSGDIVVNGGTGCQFSDDRPCELR